MQENQPNIILRITALWAFSEAFLGGILHGFKVPFSGLFLAFFASLCITLIALANKKRGFIFNATLAVIAVKFVLSPQTPPMAYFAVLVQGLAGELFFLRRKNYRVAAFSLTLFSLVYSALQQLVILTILFGQNFWKAMDTFLNKTAGTFVHGETPYTVYIVGFYLLCYVIVGIAGGIMNSNIAQNILTGKWENNLPVHLPLQAFELSSSDRKPPGEKKGKGPMFFSAGLLFIALMLSYLPFFAGIFEKNKVAPVLVRGLCIMLAWNFFAAPILIKLVGNWVEKYKTKEPGKLKQVILLIPEIRKIIEMSWDMANASSTILRLKAFVINAVILIFYYEKQRSYSHR